MDEADAGVVYRSDVTPGLSRYIRVLEIPEAANVVAAYPIAAAANAPHPDEAKAFVGLVLSGEGQKILAHWGFIPLSSP